MSVSRRFFLKAAVGVSLASRLPLSREDRDLVFPPTTPKTLRAYPFLVAKSVVIDRIAFEILHGLPGETASAGIYRSASDNVLTPSKLEISTGSHDLTAGVKVSSIHLRLPAGLYWWALLGNLTFPALRTPSRKGTRSQYTVEIEGDRLPSEFPGRGKLETIGHEAMPVLAFRCDSDPPDCYYAGGIA